MSLSPLRPGLDVLYSAWHVTALYLSPQSQIVPCRGTAFGVKVEGEDRILAVTNRHLLDPEYPETDDRLAGCTLSNLVFTFFVADPSGLGPALPSAHTYTSPAGRQIVHHRDDTVDVAAVVIDLEEIRSSVIALPPLFTSESLADSAFTRESLDVGEKVYIPGFPGETYDGTNVLPVCRTGRIATDPRLDYRKTVGPAMRKDGRSKIALDAFLTEGSSGSPVLLDRGAEFLRDRRLLGVAVGHVVSGGAGVSNTTHSGISYMHTSECIQDILSRLN